MSELRRPSEAQCSIASVNSIKSSPYLFGVEQQAQSLCGFSVVKTSQFATFLMPIIIMQIN